MRFKPLLVLIATTASLSLISITNANAQTSDNDYLKQIADNTYNTLQKVDTLPAYLTAASQLVLAWMNPMTTDASPPLANLQTSITQLGDLIVQDQAKQAALLPLINLDLLNNDGNNVFNTNYGRANTGTPPGSDTLIYANDLTYSTILGAPYFPQDPRNQPGETPTVNPAYNFIKNAAGLNIYHRIPNASWKDGNAKKRYQNYFNTVMAVESFNAYVLSNQLIDGNQLNTLQTTLVTQATDPTNWIAEVASENIGFVLRQILLYQSQLFVLMTQQVQLQKQMVTAQVMTNATLIAINQLNENVMVSNAQGVQPSSS